MLAVRVLARHHFNAHRHHLLDLPGVPLWSGVVESPVVRFPAARVPPGAGGVRPGGAGLEQDRVQRQPAVHQSHRRAAGPV